MSFRKSRHDKWFDKKTDVWLGMIGGGNWQHGNFYLTSFTVPWASESIQNYRRSIPAVVSIGQHENSIALH